MNTSVSEIEIGFRAMSAFLGEEFDSWAEGTRILIGGCFESSEFMYIRPEVMP